MSYVSVWRATARALVELGCSAFFIAGIAAVALGPSAPWLVLGAVLIGLAVRTIDVEARALFVPGGLYGMVSAALGRLPAKVAASALVVERLALGAVAAVVAGHYLAALARTIAGGEGSLGGDAAPLIVAVALVGFFWARQREGRRTSDRTIAHAVGFAIAMLGVLVLWGWISVLVHGASTAPLPFPPVDRLPADLIGASLRLPSTIAAVVLFLVGLGRALPAVGGVDALAMAAVDLEQPRIKNLQNAARLVGGYALIVTAGGAFLFVLLVPQEDWNAWASAPLGGVALGLAGPSWLRIIALAAVVAAALVFLAATVRAAAIATLGVLSRLVDEGVFPEEWRAQHPQFGTYARMIDVIAVIQLGIVFVSAGQVSWLARLYAVGVMTSLALKCAALIRYRRLRPGPRAYRVPLNVTILGRERPLGLLLIAALVTIPFVFLLVFDAPSLAGTALVLALTGLMIAANREAENRAADGAALDEFQLLPSQDEDLAQVEARPGNFLVPVRKPHSLTHLAATLREAGDRDVVAVTVRLIGVDAPDDPTIRRRATEDERRLLSAVIAVAEQEGKAVRLLIVPGVNVFDSLVETALRLRSSEIHVGESETLSADDQARLLGEAWERASKPSAIDLRLVVHHPHGGAAAYHMGAHAPALRPEDFEDIHRVWLDVVRAIGPRVRHRDVVRAALKHMEQQLNGPNRDAVLDLVRDTARPADELAAVLRERDFARLRAMLRNRPASELASLLTELALDERVLLFRILPRKTAAAAFEYLSADDQTALLKAMARDDVAALLNDMAPDDRTMFLEELPAEITRQLLALLTPEERAVAVRLLGYPEGSIGRLMTPHYIALREDWTVAQVFDYIRANGQNSETFNMLYVVDDKGLLIDDIYIREFLLAPLDTQVRSLMDKRFVALKATDDQETAVRVFRDEDRSALPVTDSAGMLIGIVTVDDVLDVAEQEATEDLQRFGGTEALDEPYMRIQFARMIRKRAGWLTALFLGEMLTATAMGAFEQEIAKAVVLALFVPLIISSGGNSGSQASTLVIRALALGEVTLADWWRVMRREFAAGLALGTILGTIGFLRITIWSAFSTIYGPHWLLVAITVALALVGIVLWGTLVGSLLPFGLRRLGFDPAASSAPFVATLVDVTGLVIYFSVGLIVLRGTLL